MINMDNICEISYGIFICVGLEILFLENFELFCF